MATMHEWDDLTYFARPELSASGMKTILEPGGLARFHYFRAHARKDKPAYNFGHAVHTILTGKGDPMVEIPAEHLDATGGLRRKVAQDFIKKEKAKGNNPMKAEDIKAARELARSMRDSPAGPWLSRTDGQTELAIIGEIDGVPIRSKLDFLFPDAIVDTKSAASAHLGDFEKKVYSFGYDIQAWVYTELIRQATGETLPFLFLAGEKDAPHLPAMIRLSDTYMEIGEARAREAIRRFHEATETGQWPGYPADVQTAEPPKWALEWLADDTAGLNSPADLDDDTEAAMAAFLEGEFQ